MITLSPRPAALVAPPRGAKPVAWFENDSFTDRPGEHGWPLPFDAPDEPSDLDDPTVSPGDDKRWDVFLPDDDPYEPRPQPGDFWIDAEDE
jgi:hypothetical protein